MALDQPMTSDDTMSASQLRDRYGRDGSAGDSELSASQLRSRYSVETNSFRPGGNVQCIYMLVFVIIIMSYILRQLSLG